MKASLLINQILLPVDFPISSPSIFQQAATLAEHFHANILLLHVATAASHAAGVPTDSRDLANWNLLAQILRGQNLDASLRAKLQALPIRSLVMDGDPARAILEAAASENANLIIMSSHGFTFDQFLLGSVAAKVLRWNQQCPVWTGAHKEELPAADFSIRNVLCAVDLGPRSEDAASWAAQLAGAFNAHLTLTHVTEPMAIVSPGGSWTNPEYQQTLVDDASHRLTELKKKLSINADLLIGSGAVPKVLSQIAKQTKADLLVLDCYPSGSNLRVHAYAIICAVSIPVVSV